MLKIFKIIWMKMILIKKQKLHKKLELIKIIFKFLNKEKMLVFYIIKRLIKKIQKLKIIIMNKSIIKIY